MLTNAPTPTTMNEATEARLHQAAAIITGMAHANGTSLAYELDAYLQRSTFGPALRERLAALVNA